MISVPEAATRLLWPQGKGHQIELLDGPDAGVYTISELLYTASGSAPAAGEVTNPSTLFTSAQIGTYPGATDRVAHVRVSTPPVGGFAARTGLRWRLLPVFADETDVPYTIVGVGSRSGTAVTFGRALLTYYSASNYEPFVLVRYQNTVGTQLHARSVINAFASTVPAAYLYYPLYLFDQLGRAGREILDMLTAAGVVADPDSLIRDAAGLHHLD